MGAKDVFFRIASFDIWVESPSTHGAAVTEALLRAGLRPGHILASSGFAHLPDEDALAALARRWNVPCGVIPLVDSRGAESLPSFSNAIVLADAVVSLGKLADVLDRPLIKIHPAPLPAYRGDCITAWALYHDEPLEVCVICLNGMRPATGGLEPTEPDAGPILARRPLPVHRGDGLAEIEQRGNELGVELLADALRRAIAQGVPSQPQLAWEGRTFRGEMPADIRQELSRRLAAQEYTHYA